MKIAFLFVLIVVLVCLVVLRLKDKKQAEWLQAKEDSHRFLGLKRSKKYGEY